MRANCEKWGVFDEEEGNVFTKVKLFLQRNYRI